MSEEYKTGYKRPPLKSRFKPGQSGNIKGRPKRMKPNINVLADYILQEMVTVKENGRNVRMPRIELALRNCIQKAAGGDLRALSTLVKMAKQSEVLTDPPIPQQRSVLIVPEVSKTIEEWTARAQKQSAELQKRLAEEKAAEAKKH